MNYISAIFLIGFAILFHELGHFLAARYVNIPIKVFSIGFGPALWKKQLGNTEYRISLIPLGGYVMPDIDDENHFFSMPVSKRIVMAAGGPIASALLPVICFGTLNCYNAGFALNNIFAQPFLQAWAIGCQMIITLPSLIESPGQLSGVVGIVAQGGQFVGTNPVKAIRFLALISMNLCIMNLIPLPVLDGGKILLYFTEKIHPVFIRLHIPLSIAGWVLIMGLTAYTIVIDVLKYVT